MKALKTISAAYIDWAHGPSAEDGHPPAVRLVALASGNPRLDLGSLLESATLREELRQVAEIWATSDGTSDNAKYCRTARGIVAAIKERLRLGRND